MPTREQRNTDTIQAILELLVAEGIITNYEAAKMKNITDYNECTELSEGLCERRKK